MALKNHDVKADKAIREAIETVGDNMLDGRYKSMAISKLQEALLLVHASDIIDHQ